MTGWEGRRIVLTQPLYSIVDDERSRFLPSLKKRGKVTGLTVTTPSATYYEFEALRESEDHHRARSESRRLDVAEPVTG